MTASAHPTALLPDEVTTARRLAAGYAVVVGVTFCLIVLGALVRANDAGLACPDWPLCFGEVVPRMNVKIAFEWGHRVLAGGVALGFAALATWTLRYPALRARCGRLLALDLGQYQAGTITVVAAAHIGLYSK